MGLLEELSTVVKDVNIFVIRAHNLIPKLDGDYDPNIRECYYAISDRRKELGSALSQLRYKSSARAEEAAEGEILSLAVRHLDKQLSKEITALQGHYLKYLARYQKEIFAPVTQSTPAQVVQTTISSEGQLVAVAAF